MALYTLFAILLSFALSSKIQFKISYSLLSNILHFKPLSDWPYGYILTFSNFIYLVIYFSFVFVRALCTTLYFFVLY